MEMRLRWTKTSVVARVVHERRLVLLVYRHRADAPDQDHMVSCDVHRRYTALSPRQCAVEYWRT